MVVGGKCGVGDSFFILPSWGKCSFHRAGVGMAIPGNMSLHNCVMVADDDNVNMHHTTARMQISGNTKTSQFVVTDCYGMVINVLVVFCDAW